jgi:cytochrome c553
MKTAIVTAVLSLASVLPIAAGRRLCAADPADLEFFEKRVRPLLATHCHECHAADTESSGGLLLDSRAGWERGGDSGPAIVPGKPDESLLVRAVSWADPDLQMPPKSRLPAADQATLAEWIRRGAFDPRAAIAAAARQSTAMSLEEGRRFWSYAPLADPPAPAVKNAAWPRTDVDRFVLAGLESAGIDPAADADPAALARRLSYALTGLPPTVAQLERFGEECGQDRAAAIEVLTEELLASTAFAERWAGHWLDIVRFAESSGGGRTLLFPDAWRFRDAVIDAFRENRPLDRLIREHVAGDLLPAASREDRTRQLVATGFLALGPTIYEEQDKQRLRFDVIDEQLDTIGRAFLGQTLGCARCHDHKFDPLSQRDYYALAGIFASTRTLSNYTDNVVGWVTAQLPLDADDEQRFADAGAELTRGQARLKAAKNELAKLKDAASGLAARANQPIPLSDVGGIAIDDTQAQVNGMWKHSTHSPHYFGTGYLHDERSGKGEKTITFTPRLPASGRYEVRFAYVAAPDRSAAVPVHIFHAMGDVTVQVDQTKPPDVEGRFVSLGTYGFEKDGDGYVIVSTEETEGYVTADLIQFLPVTAAAAETDSNDKDAARELRQEIAGLEARIKELKAVTAARPVAMAVREEDQVGDTEIRIRGEVHKKGASVPRGVPAVLAREPLAVPPDHSGRAELAAWLVSADNPLAARVMANRIWTWLFGQGLVRSVDNFGTTGEPPTHPKLLDHLARRLQERSWDVRALIRELIRSRTWQLAVAVEPRDPDNRLLSHAHRRRLDAEELRDTMLVVSGDLDTAVGGANIAGAGPAAPDAGEASAVEFQYRFTDTRRSLYTPAFRNNRLELFTAFDFADINSSQGQRPATTVSTQALYLMNHPFVVEQSRHAARRLLASAADGPGPAAIAGSTRDAALLRQACLTTLARPPRAAEQEACLALLAAAGDTAEARTEAWSMIFQSLFGCIDFRYLD